MTESWRDYFLGLARQAALGSKDPKSPVGAVLADANNVLISSAFNGFPIGVDDSPMESLQAREAAQDGVLHAEPNVLIFADRARLPGSVLVVTKSPCVPCAAVICQYRRVWGGPVEVICPPMAPDSQHLASKPFRDRMLAQAGVLLTELAA